MVGTVDRSRKIGGSIAVLGYLAGALVRFVPHVWNAVPFGAATLVGGASLGPVFSMASLFGTLFVTDLFLWLLKYRALGFAPFGWSTLFVYGGYVGYVVAGWMLRRRSRWPLVPVAALGGSVFFFLVSNFGVWVSGGYPRTLDGLLQCYAAAIPFYRGTLLGDIVYSVIFFAVWFVLDRITQPVESVENRPSEEPAE